MTGTSRAGHLEEVSRLFWPEPMSWTIGRSSDVEPGTSVQSFLIIPSARNPRLIVPSAPRVASAAVRNLHGGSRLRDRARGVVLTQLLRTRAGRSAFRDRLEIRGDASSDAGGSTLKATLDEVTGFNTHWSMPVSRARANRKPVLQLLNGDGRQVAFVKVGTNDLTRDLVRAEGATLSALPRRTTHTSWPELIGRTTWRSLELLLLRPLPFDGARRALPYDRMVRSARELATIEGVRRVTFVESSYWMQLGERLRRGTDPRSRSLTELWRALGEHCRNESLDLGAWHGDWAPWNMTWARDRLLVWDFERFARDVPVGYDLVHFDLQTRILDPSKPSDVTIVDRLDAAPDTLRAMGVDRKESYLVFTAYLLEIASRWIDDGQAGAGGWGGVLDGMVCAAQRATARVIAELGAGEGVRWS